MADPRAFVSFDFDHNEVSRNLFVGQAKSSSPTPFTVSDWSSKAALSQAQWERLIADKISRTNLVIVLMGRYMASALGVAKEIAVAKRNRVPVFGVYVENAGTGSTLPSGLSRNRVVPWTWPNIAAGIKTCMNEGKNAS